MVISVFIDVPETPRRRKERRKVFEADQQPRAKIKYTHLSSKYVTSPIAFIISQLVMTFESVLLEDRVAQLIAWRFVESPSIIHGSSFPKRNH